MKLEAMNACEEIITRNKNGYYARITRVLRVRTQRTRGIQQVPNTVFLVISLSRAVAPKLFFALVYQEWQLSLCLFLFVGH